jgi:mannosyltransferase
MFHFQLPPFSHEALFANAALVQWGDAPVHSFAAALLLQPHEIHLFGLFGYEHEPFWVEPFNEKGGQIPAADHGVSSRAPEKPGGIGCRCTRDDSKTGDTGHGY